MATELDVLGLVSDRLTAVGVPFMLTGSFALAYYTTPRMTRDLNIVVSLEARDVDPLVRAFAHDFYIDADMARSAMVDERLFNAMHLDSGGLTQRERRLAVARRFYGTELPEAALAAYARYETHAGKQGSGRSDVSVRATELLTDSIAAKTSGRRAEPVRGEK